MKLRNEVQWRRTGDEPGFLIDTRVGGVHGLNATAAVILGALNSGADSKALEAAVRDRYAVGQLAAQQDVQAFTQMLMENDLVEH